MLLFYSGKFANLSGSVGDCCSSTVCVCSFLVICTLMTMIITEVIKNVTFILETSLCLNGGSCFPNKAVSRPENAARLEESIKKIWYKLWIL